MTAPVLVEGQYSLDDKVTFGMQGPIVVQNLTIGDPAITSQDAGQDNADGVRFGRDQRGSRTLTFDLVADGSGKNSDPEALARSVEAAWLADDVRTVPGAVSVLRYCKGGQQRRTYGRSRKIAPVIGNYRVGVTEYTAEFVTRDHLFFDDAEQTVDVSIIPPTSGGVMSPVTSPVSTVATSQFQGQFTIGGSSPTPLVTTIYGPITTPVVQLLNHWTITLQGSLASDNWVTIDPIAGSVLDRFGVNWAGKFTADSPQLQDMILAPGATTLVLRGTDATGTARVQGAWRNASSSF